MHYRVYPGIIEHKICYIAFPVHTLWKYPTELIVLPFRVKLVDDDVGILRLS